MTNESDTYAQAEPGKAPGSTYERKEMSFKTLRKRIALVAVAALAVTGLSTVPANAFTVTNSNDGTPWAVSSAYASTSSSATQVVGGVVTLNFVETNLITGSTDSIIGNITSSGVGSLTSVTSDQSSEVSIKALGTTTETAVFPNQGVTRIADAVSTNSSIGDLYTLTVVVSSQVAGTQTLTGTVNNSSGTPTNTYSFTVNWVAATATGISKDKSTMYVATDDGNCSDVGNSKAEDSVIAAAEAISRTATATAVDICIIARDANENLLTIASSTVVSSTLGRSATTPTDETGEYRIDLAAANALLSGVETLTAVVVDAYGNAAVLTTTLTVYGSLKKLEISAVQGSAYAAADQATTDIDAFTEWAAATATSRVLVVGIKGTDANNAVIDLNVSANSVTASTWTVDSDKVAGAPADRASQTIGASLNDFSPETGELGSTKYGTNVQYLVCGTLPEKLTLTAWGKDSDGNWLKSNSLDVYCAGGADKVEVTASGQSVNVKVTDANGYPVADGTSVSLAASNGSVVAPSTKTTKNGVFATPATFIANSTAATSSVTAIVGTKSGTSTPVAGTGNSIEAQVSSLVAAIAKLQKAINKINKRLAR